ncbi:MAG: hypothetical protein GF307_02850 [candidate division Zixibacteria bacterium]|nr:hypothetical protein [candidate division Zixibacteria bacterium]
MRDLMKTMTAKILVGSILCLFVLSLSCSRDVTEPENCGSLAIDAVWQDGPKHIDNSSKNSGKLSKPYDAPPGVTSMVVRVSGSDFSTIERSFDASQNTGRIDDIPAGSGRTVSVSARDNSNQEQYSYTESNVSIDPGEVRRINVTLSQVLPSAPSNLGAQWDGGNNAILVTWSDNSYNEDRFLVERSTVGGSNYSVIDTAYANNTSCRDYDFNYSEEYYYRVCAENSGGTSSYSNEYHFDASVLGQAPNAPSNLETYWHSSTEIAVAWTDNSNNEDQFAIERRTASGTWQFLANTGPDTSYYRDASFTSNEEYYYRVAAVNTYGTSSFTGESYFNTQNPPPARPVMLASWYDGTRTELYWNQNPGVDYSAVYRRGAGSSIVDSLGNVYGDSTFQDNSSLSNGWYIYFVRAHNSYGFSDPSFVDSVFVDNNGPLYFRGLIENSNQLGRMDIDDNYLYVAEGPNLKIYNLNYPLAPRYLSTYNAGSTVNDLSIENNYAFLATNSNGMVAVNISDKLSPANAGAYFPSMEFSAVCVKSNVAYVGKGGDGLHTVDVSTPSSMTQYMVYNGVTEIYDIFLQTTVDSSYVYLAAGSNGLHVANVTEPNNVYNVASYNIMSGFTHALDFDGTYAYLANGTAGMQVINCGAWAMTDMGSVSTNDATGIFYHNSNIFLADKTGGFKIFDVSSYPSLTETFPMSGDCIDVIRRTTYNELYVTVPGVGIYIFEY